MPGSLFVKAALAAAFAAFLSGAAAAQSRSALVVGNGAPICRSLPAKYLCKS